jgi:hypothetical protein
MISNDEGKKGEKESGEKVGGGEWQAGRLSSDIESMAVPETDLARIRRFCEKQVPPEVRDQVRVEYRVRGRTVTIVEHRPPWTAALSPEWTDTPQARKKYDEQTTGWTLYWFDRNSRTHRYDLLERDEPIGAAQASRPAVERLLAEYDQDPTCIFNGRPGRIADAAGSDTLFTLRR